MSRKCPGPALDDLRRVFEGGLAGGPDDGELLGRFLAAPGRRGEEAFAALVGRHGPGVLGICRRLLGDEHAAADAFQATFLVLARRAPAIAHRGRLGGWLHGVAVRVCREARRRAARRRARERPLGDAAAALAASAAGPPAEGPRAAVAEELARLPERYRDPIALCDLEGLSRREAAARLAVPEGTISSRLARGRSLLRGRLARRGIAPAGLAGVLGGRATAGVPAALARRAAEGAMVATWGGAAAGAVPAAVSGMAGRVLMIMFIAQWKAGLAAVAALGAALAIGGARADRPEVGARGDEAPGEIAAAKVAGARALPDVDDILRFIARGEVVDEQGRPVADVRVEVISVVDRERGETDADGGYAVPIVLRSLNDTRIMLLASDEGRGRLGFAEGDLEPGDGEAGDATRIRLKPSREVVIRVEDEAGEPVDGAAVEVLALLRPIAEARTGPDGRAAVLLPADAPIEWIAGLKADIGFDYAELGPERHVGRPASELPDEVVLVLDGARTVHVKAVGSDGGPLAGIGFVPSSIRKKDRRDQINLSASQIVREATGADGIASFRWFPSESPWIVSFSPRGIGYDAPIRTTLGPDAEPGVTLVAELMRPGMIGGRVARPDGTPAAGVRIIVSGMGAHGADGAHFVTRTAADGTYRAVAKPMRSYVVGVADEEWAAPSRFVGLVVREGQAIAGVDFRLDRGATIRGTVRKPPDWGPAAGEYVALRQVVGTLPEELQPAGLSEPREALLFRWAKTDRDGTYRFRVGPGTYGALHGRQRRQPKPIEVVEGGEYTADLDAIDR